MSLLLCLALSVFLVDARDLTLQLSKVLPSESPLAKCLDGSPPAYYWRPGVADGALSALLFLEGGGWCYPSDTNQTSGANCAVRALSGLGSSTSYTSSIASTGYEGGQGFTSGDPSVTAWANWAVSYVKYCDGGSMSGTRMDNHDRGLYYRGHFNLEAQLAHMVKYQGLGGYKEIVLAGCSAGGMACFIKCDFVASYFRNHSIPVKCICDAGVFTDVDTVTGAGNVMQVRYHDIAETMQSKPGLSPACVAGQTDWRQCLFSEHSFKYTSTDTFVINSIYNFGEWEHLLPPYPAGTFPPDATTPPPDWTACWPTVSGLTPITYPHCNATQREVLALVYSQFVAATAPAHSVDTSHGAFLDSCPNQHCQTSTGWASVLVNNTTMAAAAARWYFNNSVEKHVDAPFPGNPTCGFAEGVKSICSNCANQGIGSNCVWDSVAGKFHKGVGT